MSGEFRESQTKRDEDRDESVLIAAQPDQMRASLHILLTGILGLNIVDYADDSAAALQMLTEQRPALVLLDTNLPGARLSNLLKHIKINRPWSHCLVLADTMRLQREALAAGADEALLKGFPAVELFEAIEEALAEREARSEELSDRGKQSDVINLGR